MRRLVQAAAIAVTFAVSIISTQRLWAEVPAEFQPNYDAGFSSGYDVGYESGLTAGNERGKKEGAVKGNDDGYRSGWRETYPPAFQRTYDINYPLGHWDGWQIGVRGGFDAGSHWTPPNSSNDQGWFGTILSSGTVLS